MNKALFIIFFLFVYFTGFSQPITNRSSTAITVQDGNLFALNSFRPASFADTTAANAVTTLDSAGKLIYTYDVNSYWIRSNNPRRWVRILKDGDAGNVNANNGISLSGDTVQLGGFLTKNTSIDGNDTHNMDFVGIRKLRLVTSGGFDNDESIIISASDTLDLGGDVVKLSTINRNSGGQLKPILLDTINNRLSYGDIPDAGIQSVTGQFGLNNINDSTLEADTTSGGVTSWVRTRKVIDSLGLTVPDSLVQLVDVIINGITNGQVVSYDNGAWINSNVGTLLGGIFSTPGNTVYTGIVRASVAGSGQPVLWSILKDGTHTNYGFGPAITGTSVGFNMDIPTAIRVQTVLVISDNSLGNFGVLAGSSFGTQTNNVTVYYNKGTQGGSLRGNNTATLTKDVEIGGWTISYVPTTGSIFFTFPAGNPIIPSVGAGVIAMYTGPNNYHTRTINSGLGSANMGIQLLDAGGNPVTDTLINTEYIQVNSKFSQRDMTVNGLTGSGANLTLYSGSINFWCIAVVEEDPLTPDSVTNIVLTPSSTQVALDWDDVPLATTYEVLRSTLQNSGYASVYTGATSAFTDTGLTNGVTYYYRVRAINSPRNSLMVVRSAVPN